MSNSIADYYDEHCHEEDNRLSDNSMEYLLTYRLIREYAPEAITVCDIGGATGNYAIPLAMSGKKVLLCDVSHKEIELAKERALKSHVELQYKHCDVFRDNIIEGNTYDLVLCLGPLYHCRNLTDVKTVLSTINSLMHNSSVAVLSFLSKYAKLNCMSRRQILSRTDTNSLVRYYGIIDKSRNQPFYFRKTKGLPVSYITPESIGIYLKNQGFCVKDVVSVDVFDRCAYFDDDQQQESFMKMAYQVGRLEKINDGSHIVAVIKK